MHSEHWFPFFGLGHWGLGLLAWVIIFIAVIGLLKTLFPNNKE